VFFLIDQRCYLAAFFMAVFFGLSLYPFVGAFSIFAENGLALAWADIGFLLVVLVCLAYVSLFSYSFAKQFCVWSSARVCFIFFHDKLIWAEKWLGHYKTITLVYNDVTTVTHGFLNGGGDVGRGLYIDHNLLLSGDQSDRLCRWLYFVAENYIAAQRTVFKDVDQPVETQSDD